MALLQPAGARAVAPAPSWQIALRSQQTNFRPGQLSQPQAPRYVLTADNVGGFHTSGPITLTVQLPEGISPAAAEAPLAADQSHSSGSGTSCSLAGQTATCTDVNSIDPGEWVTMEVPVDVANLPDPTVLDALATISGGDAGSATAQISTTVSNTPAPFGFLPGYEGLNASAVKEDGTPASQAGSHPQQLNLNLGLPTTANAAGSAVLPDGTLDDVKVDLPAGVVVNPAATPKCTAAQLTVSTCPDSSQVGIATIPLTTGTSFSEPIYNMVAPPGYAADFGANFSPVPVHILGGVRPGDYRITSLSPEAPSLLAIFAVRIQIWGSPSDPSHDAVRGECSSGPVGMTCPVSRTGVPLISLPTACTDSMRIDAHVSLWEELGKFYDRDTELTDSNGNPTPVTGCNQLQFNPTLKARPTTDVADSPSGLAVDLGVPQADGDLNTLATAHLRKAVLTLPEGLVLNPSAANGLDSCDSVTCPDASRIGTVEVDTPLLDHPLSGSVFLATPHDNPFDSLLAIYVVVDDPSTGTLIKLSARVIADPVTGRLKAIADDNPQIPFEQARLDFFGGAYAPLRTPATCGTYATTSQLTPWSAPDSGPPATPKDSWQISRGPGGSCAPNQSSLPNSPSFEAGSAGLIAGHPSAFVLHLHRNDATQSFSALTLSPPPGLVANLAGAKTCPDSALEAAARKSGGEEKANPSCPADSEVGSFVVGAGAGPSPYYAPGKVYLAGPYKGASLSFAFITPAVAGPFDLGTILTRAAVHIDPETARVTIVSDPLPEILGGIPLDIRSVDVSLDRPGFIRNGTSCDPSSVEGTLTSTLGSSISLSSRFQLAECRSLAFRPKLGLRLSAGLGRGAHPRVAIDLAPRPGEANLAAATFALPPGELLDTRHIGALCPRDLPPARCPRASRLGQVRLRSPLLGGSIQGPVYLRAPSHRYPDLLADLRGADRLHLLLHGRTAAAPGGRLRIHLPDLPDLPLSKATIVLAGGSRGIFVNSESLCARPLHATAALSAHNGKQRHLRPLLRLRGRCRS